MKAIREYLIELFHKRLVIYQLARQDFRNRYLGSSLGFVWTLIQPLVMMLILWFVFTLAFRVSAIRGMPFVAWFLPAMAAWSFFAEALSLSTSVFQEYAFLVKKVNFQIAVLPLVKILSCLAVHGIFLLIVIVILLCNHVPVSWYWLQTLYYAAGLVVLLQGVSWITSSLNVFVRDVAYIVNILLQFGFWLTPIFWDVGMLSPEHRPYLILLKLNPLYYIVDGYRRSFLFHEPFWTDAAGAALFWLMTALMLTLGAGLFRRLKPHFADVL